uniref:Type I restriction modification DNA specificity domain-containing protein n=1 Tax=Candidatus Kentrum sp. LPFa TaxID=2126335 RepID=A0A450WNH8_9GAMM|nr:MAG: Type I restriction modification DNA specificity domain-containing protein [Candidatus Kentron sp. LPFa]
MNAQPTGIGDCAEVLPGYSFKTSAKHQPSGSYQVILGKHLLTPSPVPGYRYYPEHELRFTPKGKMENYLVKAGNVLLVSRGVRNQAVLVKSVPRKTIASATFYLLRVRDGVDPAYLAWFLNQTPTQSRIREVRTGAGTPIIQRKLFVELVIPLPSYEDQRKIAKIGEYMAKERILRQTLMERTVALHRSIGRQLIRDLASTRND